MQTVKTKPIILYRFYNDRILKNEIFLVTSIDNRNILNI